MAETGILTTDSFPNAYDGVPDDRGQGNGRGRGVSKLFGYIDAVNIADGLSSDVLSRIGDRVVREYTIDKESRADWEDRCQEAMDLAMQVAEDKQYPWPKAANVKYPLVTTAAIQFAARAYPAIVQGRNVVKGQVLGNDDGVEADRDEQGQVIYQPGKEPGAKREKADRIARHMSWQLTDEIEEWDEDTDKLLHMLPVIGCVFRKVWFDPGLGRNRSELVTAKDLVVNYKARTLETTPRITQVLPPMYPHEITEKVRMGRWREVELGMPEEAGDDRDAPHMFLEQHRKLDLDDDGYPEPYIVTVHERTREVMRIVARFDEDGITLNRRGEVAKIEPVHYFVKYPFLPSLDGGFYDMGFGTLLNPLNEAVNGSLNQLLDAGHLQNTGGGFIGRGLRIKGGATRFRPGEWKPVDVSGGTIRDNVFPIPFGEPSAVLFNLLGLLIDAAKDITATKDILTGEQGKVEPASTTLARLEQGLKVFTAIWKRVFRAEKKELKLLRRLNRLYMDDEKYFAFHDDPEAVAPEDYADEEMDVVPVADPGVVTDMQKLAKAEFLLQFLPDPYFNPREIRERLLDAASIDDVEKLLIEGPPPTDPKVAEMADKMEMEKRRQAIEEIKLDWEIAEIESNTLLNIAKAEAAEAGPQMEKYKQEMAVVIERIRAKQRQQGNGRANA